MSKYFIYTSQVFHDRTSQEDLSGNNICNSSNGSDVGLARFTFISKLRFKKVHSILL